MTCLRSDLHYVFINSNVLLSPFLENDHMSFISLCFTKESIRRHVSQMLQILQDWRDANFIYVGVSKQRRNKIKESVSFPFVLPRVLYLVLSKQILRFVLSVRPLPDIYQTTLAME